MELSQHTLNVGELRETFVGMWRKAVRSIQYSGCHLALILITNQFHASWNRLSLRRKDWEFRVTGVDADYDFRKTHRGGDF